MSLLSTALGKRNIEISCSTIDVFPRFLYTVAISRLHYLLRSSVSGPCFVNRETIGSMWPLWFSVTEIGAKKKFIVLQIRACLLVYNICVKKETLVRISVTKWEDCVSSLGVKVITKMWETILFLKCRMKPICSNDGKP